jgi:hypothetical protein
MRARIVVGSFATVLFLSGCSGGGGHHTAPRVTTTTVPAKSEVADPNGFGGYHLRGHVTEIGASWTVPAIAASSSAGHASTWIGVADKARDFIQIGTLEDRLSDGPEYDAFWSDTAVHFRPQRIAMFVEPGDSIHAEMVQQSNGWLLTIADDTSNDSWPWVSHYGVGATFDTSEWYQEDAASSAANDLVDLPYPKMSTVTFRHLLVNGRAPVLPHSNAHALVSGNGVSLVPTHFTNDAFSVNAATKLQAHYLDNIAPYNAVVNAWATAVRRGDRDARRGATTDLIVAIAHMDGSLRTQTWPPGTQAAVGAFVEDHGTLTLDLSAWARSASSSPRALAAISADMKRAQVAADQIRAAVGLPPA